MYTYIILSVIWIVIFLILHTAFKLELFKTILISALGLIISYCVISGIQYKSAKFETKCYKTYILDTLKPDTNLIFISKKVAIDSSNRIIIKISGDLKILDTNRIFSKMPIGDTIESLKKYRDYAIPTKWTTAYGFYGKNEKESIYLHDTTIKKILEIIKIKFK